VIALAPVNRRRAANIRPTRPARPFGEFCRTLRLPDGKHAGKIWIPETEPSQAAFIRHVESGRWRQFTIVAPTQRGKTLKGILAPFLHATTERRQAVAYVLPSLDLLAKNWDSKIKPALEGTGYGAWLPTKGPGSKGGKPAVLTLRDPSTGAVAAKAYFMATGTGKRESSTSSVPCQTVLYDEADDALDDGTIKRVYKRAESYGPDGFAFGVSTVNDIPGRESPDANDPDAAHPILVLERQGSRHRMHHRCPHCRGYFQPQMEDMDLDRRAIVCRLCAVIWSEENRTDALNHALSVGGNDTIVGESVHEGAYDHFHYSEITTGLDYHMANVASICEEISEAKRAEAAGRYALMRTCMHKVFCKSYTEPRGATEITNAGLANVSAASDYNKRTVPHWVNFLSCGVDVQGDRLYWIVVGHGPDDRWCIVDWGYEMLVPSGQDRSGTPADRRRALTELDAKMDHGWQIEGRDETHEAPRMSPLAGLRAIDVGAYTDEITGWLRGVRGWRACRGVGKDTLRQLGKVLELPPEAKAFVEVRQPEGWFIPLVNVNGGNVRKWVHAALLRAPGTPASGMLPRGLKSNDSLLLHLSGEVWREPNDNEIFQPYFEEVRVRHDLLDALIYAIALSRLRAGIQTVQANRRAVKYGRLGDVGVKR
jgi:hypothetical protein